MTYATGEAAPRFSATTAGNAKMPAPMVALTILEVRPGRPMPRTNCASAFRDGSEAMAKQWLLHSMPTSLSQSRPAAAEAPNVAVAKGNEVGLVCERCATATSKIIIPFCGSRVSPPTNSSGKSGRVRAVAREQIANHRARDAARADAGPSGGLGQEQTSPRPAQRHDLRALR